MQKDSLELVNIKELENLQLKEFSITKMIYKEFEAHTCSTEKYKHELNLMY